MKNSFVDRYIEKRLGGYTQQINNVETNLPQNCSDKKSVAIIGGGIAGMVSSTLLAERDFKVSLFEKYDYLGGKIGSWPVTFKDGYKTDVEHGFHGFFKQYYNLRNYLTKIDSFKHLIPISDYLILTKEKREFRFKDINTTPVKNILSLAKNGVYKISPFLTNPKSAQMIDLLKYDSNKTFEKWDDINFEQFSESLKLPKELILVFETFARAFFADASKISMGELIKSFHFYFLSHDYGLLYDVLDDDFSITFIQKFLDHINQYDFNYKLNFNYDKVERRNDKFLVDGNEYDYLILAADIKGIKSIFKNSDFVTQNYPQVSSQIAEQKISQKYAVLRLWMDKKLEGDYPFFIFTEAFEILDSITLYHDMEKSSREWANKNGGGIYELHSYAVSNNKLTDSEVREKLIEEFLTYFPEMKSSKIIYEHLQVKDDFTAFHTGLYKNRPTTNPGIENLYFAGDWVKLPVPAMLMEAAATSAIYAVNNILKSENLQQEIIYTVPTKGILA